MRVALDARKEKVCLPLGWVNPLRKRYIFEAGFGRDEGLRGDLGSVQCA